MKVEILWVMNKNWKNEVERLCGKLFCTNGNATLGVRKEMIGNGMASGGDHSVCMRFEIKKMKENKATNESGVIAEYIKSLDVEDIDKLRGLMNSILNGRAIPKEWKESRVILQQKGGRSEELKNYRPITIISVICKLCLLMVRERINEWAEDSGLFGEVQGGFRRGRRT